MSLVGDLILKGISVLKPHKFIFQNEFKNTAENVKVYQNIFDNSQENKSSKYAKILDSILLENIFGKAYKKKQIKALNKIINNPNNGISLKLIKSSNKFLKFDKSNKPYIEFTKGDNIFYNFFFYIVLFVASLIPIFMLYSQYLTQSNPNDITVSLTILSLAIIMSILIFIISDYLDAKVLKNQLTIKS